MAEIVDVDDISSDESQTKEESSSESEESESEVEKPEADEEADEEAPGKFNLGSALNTETYVDKLATYKIQPVIIKDENRITLPRLSDYEYAEIISKRIMNIEATGRAMCDFGNLTDPKSIAIKELYEKKCPLSIRRKIGYKVNDEKKILYEYYEIWDVNNMMVPLAN